MKQCADRSVGGIKKATKALVGENKGRHVRRHRKEGETLHPVEMQKIARYVFASMGCTTSGVA